MKKSKEYLEGKLEGLKIGLKQVESLEKSINNHHPEFIKKIDWKLLREQKAYLLETGIETEPIEGIIHLIDAIQDYSVDEMGMSDKEVFNLTPEEE